MDLALNNLQRLICHRTQTNQQTYRSQWCASEISLTMQIFVTDLKNKPDLINPNGMGRCSLLGEEQVLWTRQSASFKFEPSDSLTSVPYVCDVLVTGML